jgi:hypothetical protein
MGFIKRYLCIYSNNNNVEKKSTTNHSIRSPSAKYFNCHAMLLKNGLNPDNDVINTGIICARKEDIIKLIFLVNLKIQLI